MADLKSTEGSEGLMMRFWAIAVVPFVLYFLWVISPPLPESEE